MPVSIANARCQVSGLTPIHRRVESAQAGHVRIRWVLGARNQSQIGLSRLNCKPAAESPQQRQRNGARQIPSNGSFDDASRLVASFLSTQFPVSGHGKPKHSPSVRVGREVVYLWFRCGVGRTMRSRLCSTSKGRGCFRSSCRPHHDYCAGKRCWILAFPKPKPPFNESHFTVQTICLPPFRIGSRWHQAHHRGTA